MSVDLPISHSLTLALHSYAHYSHLTPILPRHLLLRVRKLRSRRFCLATYAAMRGALLTINPMAIVIRRGVRFSDPYSFGSILLAYTMDIDVERQLELVNVGM